MNQNPEQLVRDRIDSELLRSGWIIQNKSSINLGAGELEIGRRGEQLSVDYEAQRTSAKPVWQSIGQRAKASHNYLFHVWDLSSNPKFYFESVDEIEAHILTNNGIGERETENLCVK